MWMSCRVKRYRCKIHKSSVYINHRKWHDMILSFSWWHPWIFNINEDGDPQSVHSITGLFCRKTQPQNFKCWRHVSSKTHIVSFGDSSHYKWRPLFRPRLSNYLHTRYRRNLCTWDRNVYIGKRQGQTELIWQLWKGGQ